MPSLLQQETVLGPESDGLRMAPEEFDAVATYDENYRYELVNGVVTVAPIPLPEEAGPNELLGHLLWFYQDAHPQGKKLDLTLAQQYVCTQTGRRLADRLIWAGLGRLPILLEDTPTIAVEWVSGTKRDRQRDYVEKRAEYMAAGIPEYWIFDRFKRTLTVICGMSAGVTEQVVAETATYESPFLPGFAMPVGRLLAAADAMAAQGHAKAHG